MRTPPTQYSAESSRSSARIHDDYYSYVSQYAPYTLGKMYVHSNSPEYEDVPAYVADLGQFLCL